MNLSGIDLNLLLAFEALIDERHVGRAAKRIGLSQPAFSNAIARLRVRLQDPLFVRRAQGMAPTLRAERISGPIGSRATAPNVRSGIHLILRKAHKDSASRSATTWNCGLFPSSPEPCTQASCKCKPIASICYSQRPKPNFEMERSILRSGTFPTPGISRPASLWNRFPKKGTLCLRAAIIPCGSTGCISGVRISGGHLILAVRRLLHRVLRFQFSKPLANRSIHLRGFRKSNDRHRELCSFQNERLAHVSVSPE